MMSALVIGPKAYLSERLSQHADITMVLRQAADLGPEAENRAFTGVAPRPAAGLLQPRSSGGPRPLRRRRGSAPPSDSARRRRGSSSPPPPGALRTRRTPSPRRPA